MTDDQVKRFITYYQACWPQAMSWPPRAWVEWRQFLKQHGPMYVRLAFEDLMHDPDYRVYPPGIAVFSQALYRHEGLYLRELDHYRGVIDRARAGGGEDADLVEKAKASIERLEQVLAR